MSGRLEIHGIDELMTELRQRMGKGIQRVENKGLREAGKPILEAQVKRVNRSRRRRSPHIGDDLRVSGVRRDKLYGTRYILIGGTKKTKFRHHFLEFGSSKSAPKPFHGPGFEEGKSESIRILADELKKGLKQ